MYIFQAGTPCILADTPCIMPRQECQPARCASLSPAPVLATCPILSQRVTAHAVKACLEIEYKGN